MKLINNTYNARWRSSFKENTNIIFGIQGMYQINTNGEKAEEILIPNSNLLDNGIYSLIQTEKNGWNVQVGARFDNRTVNSLTFFNGNAPFSSSYNGFNYSAGAVKTINKFIFRTNISSGFRPPHLSELLAKGIHHGTLRYEVGDKNLQSERATQIDFSAEYASDHLSIIANPYFTSLQNFIYIEPLNTRIDGLPVFLYKQASAAQLMGGDLGIHYHPHFAHQLHLEHSVSYIQAEDELGTPLPLIPQTRFNTTLRLEFSSKRKCRLENISVQHLYFLPQERVVSYESTSPAYQLIHIGANIKLDLKHPIKLQIGVRNLLNQEYIDHLSRLKNIGLASAGRNIYIGVRINLKHHNKKSNQ
jgi:iron complex outermembrane receptor protein